MKAAVIVFPDSNSDRDVQVALRQSMGSEPVMVWHKDSDFDKVDLIVLPGGFSYGDYLRPGAIAANSPVMKEVVARAKKGVAVLGICNGFQVLTEARLVPGTLMRNANLRYICRDVTLKVETGQSLFTAKYEQDQAIRIPIAHHDGNYFADDETLAAMEDRGQIAFRYCDPDGAVTPGANPNGSQRNIAGVYNETKTVLGLMPHPERLSDPKLGGNDGRAFFDGLVEALS
jgi:phosphoribosylformylglycinamidine synthase subunit PurQ / glutaminase